MEPKHVYYRQAASDVLDSLHTSRSGLTEAEAATRLDHDGPNALTADKPQPLVFRYFRQFTDPMVLLLMASGVLSYFLGDMRVAGLMALLILVNTFIGFSQEYKAERVMRSLTQLAVARAKVLRGSGLEEKDSAELVLGDVVFIEAGDAVPADLRIFTETSLKTNDFALTGESNPSRKFSHAISGTVPLGNRHNLAFMGTTVAEGSGYGVVVATGNYTELGRIARLSKETDSGSSPLQNEMKHIAKRVTQGTIILCLLIIPFAMNGGLGLKDALLFAIAIASSLIPQGLPAEISTALATAASKLAKSGALVKKLSAVETLGATTLICTDKTGTLTENQMTAERFLIGKGYYTVNGKGYEPKGGILLPQGHELTSEALRELNLFFVSGVFASNATVSPPDDEHPTYYAIGDPTEAAMITLGAKAGYEQKILSEQFPEHKEFPFDSARKRMSSIRPYGDGEKPQMYVFAKGAPESILERCDEIWDHGHTRKLTAKDRAYLLTQVEAGANDAMRTIAVAYRTLGTKENVGAMTMEDAESKLVWLGMVLIIDPIREEVPAAMRAALAAHMHVSVVTGDHALTARAIALRAGLAHSADGLTIVNGDELPGLDDAALGKLVIRGGIIFSRVAPEDKLRIVSLAQAHGQVVAVTGDGINDAPALKKADIGVAMGKTGTDVAKQSADIVLLDDSFHTLVGAIQQGRTIFQNIKKATLSAFSSNGAELVVILLSMAAAALFHIPLALSVMQIVAIDLIAEIFPIAALGKDKAPAAVMKAKPRNLHEHILNRFSIADLAFTGLLIGSLAFTNYLLYFNRHGVDPAIIPANTPFHMKAMTITYITIVLCQLANILMRRSDRGLFTRYQLHNRTLWGAIGFSLLCVLVIIYVPFVSNFFLTDSLHLVDWLWAIMAMIIFIAIREFQRYDRQHHRKHLHALHHRVHRTATQSR